MAALLSLAPVGEGWQVGTISDSWVYRCWTGEELARNDSIIVGITIHVGYPTLIASLLLCSLSV